MSLIQPAPLLTGDMTIPGDPIPEDIQKMIPEIMEICRKIGLDFHPTVIEFLGWDAMARVCSYGGFPARYPHWSFGMAWEEFARSYKSGMQRVYETVVNTVPVYLYCLNSNSYIDNVTVIAHALAHGDFFKNNIFFQRTSQNMMNELASHGTRIRKYASVWGQSEVDRFVDKCLSINTLIDPSAAFDKKKIKKEVYWDKRVYEEPKRLLAINDYMDGWINSPEWRAKEERRVAEVEAATILDLFGDPSLNIMGYIKDHSEFLRPWQQDILAMLYEESMYFAPQRSTKMLNEGWASFNDYVVMARIGLAGSDGIVDYAYHKARVLGGKRSMNPYKLGFNLFLHIEDCWNKGKFGREYENCKDERQKREWDLKLGLGKEKIFEVRENYNDVLAINEFMDDEFIESNKMYVWKKLPSGDYEISERDPKKIRQMLVRQYMNGHSPVIRLVEPNYKNKRIMLLDHFQDLNDTRILDKFYAKATIASLQSLWGSPVMLGTKDKDGKEIVYVAVNDDMDKVVLMTRDQAERAF